jgi:hypothetical protein
VNLPTDLPSPAALDVASIAPADLARALEALNQACFCISLDPAALERALEAELGRPGLAALLHERCPYVFAAQPVYVAPGQVQRIVEVVRAIETVVTLPAYREAVLAEAPEIARQPAPGAGPRGVFFGHDFHLSAEGQLGLIEVNTNAGGAMLNAVLARAQRACCPQIDRLVVPTPAHTRRFEAAIAAMFHQEWALFGRATGVERPLRRIAIVDEAPQDQYLYPEFLLFQALLERQGLSVVIADPAALRWRDGRLCVDAAGSADDGGPVDLVYNRLTDFYLEQPASAALRSAWEAQAVALTPHPQAHALYADKRRLAVFGDAAALRALGAPAEVAERLAAHVPRTEAVTPASAERLWAERRRHFFKPVAGYGSRAAYRGDKLTRRVWGDIVAGDYVAQALILPGERGVDAQDPARRLKFDLRAYAYDGSVQWLAARLYQGQTTNFRTPGGGFAPVYSTVAAADLSADAVPSDTIGR